MSDLVRFEKRGAIGVITVDNPPVNALSPGVPEGMAECVAKGNADPDVKAMVLIGHGGKFIAGADIKQMGKGNTTPTEWRETVEMSEKPVVAAIQGYALGGGLETAMLCNYRIASETAKIGQPEVAIGIIPGAGGTQRVPRLAGVQAALDMIVGGEHYPSSAGKDLGILDDIYSDDSFLDAAITYAEKVADVRPLPRVRDSDAKLQEAKDNPGIFDAMRKKIARKARNQRAPYACIEGVEAAVNLPFDEGLAKERELFKELVAADEAKSLRYAFFTERQARNVPDIPKDTSVTKVATVAVIGGGTMGSGITMTCADAGLPVRILEMNDEALSKAMDRIRNTYEVSVKRGSITVDQVEERMARITPITSYSDLSDCDMVIEAVFERMDVKIPVFKQLDQSMKQGAILATNSSALDIDEIAAATNRPESVIGTHFFSPANVMKLLEIVRGEKTSKEIVASCQRFAQQIAKVGVVCGNCDGFLANRSRVPFNLEMNLLIEDGALPQDVDKVMYEFGYPMGPFAVADLAGNDIGWEGRKRRYAANPDARKLPIPDTICEMGRFGQKTRAGWFDYKEGDRTPYPSEVVEKIISDYREEAGITSKSFSDEEILRRILFSSINEICKILDEGIAYKATDADVMWLNGFGFPRYRGGVMFWADQIGVKAVYEQISAWHDELGDRWAPSPYLKKLADQGKSFTGD